MSRKTRRLIELRGSAAEVDQTIADIQSNVDYDALDVEIAEITGAGLWEGLMCLPDAVKAMISACWRRS